MIRIALIADELTSACLSPEAKVMHLTPLNYRWVLKMRRPDVLIVESAWHGLRQAWKYKIASYPDQPRRNNDTLRRIVAYARDLGIPAVFWNKEDGVHFERFIASASLFEHIFTVDENCIARYRAQVGAQVTVNSLMFPVQPAIHHFDGFHFKYHRADFVGSYSHHIHDSRRGWQDALFGAAARSGLGLTAFDRNSDRKSANYRFPPLPGVEVRAAVAHARTAGIYKDYLVSLNVNTVVDSPTMFSRRLVEILACGGVAVTNPSVAVERHFKDYCHVVHSEEEAVELFSRLKHGPSAEDLERAEAGALYVRAEHVWSKRLESIMAVIA